MKVICYGDSNTYGYDPRDPRGSRYEMPWPEILAEKTHWQVINQGENGREIPKTAVTFPADTDLLMVMLGTNDLLQFWSPEAACKKMEHFLKKCWRYTELIRRHFYNEWKALCCWNSYRKFKGFQPTCR